MKNYFSFILFLLISGYLSAQITEQDTVYLNDGTFMEGVVLNPGSEGSIQVQSKDGAIIFIQNSRISKIAIHTPKPEKKEPSPFSSNNNQRFQQSYSKPRSIFKLDAGVGIPMGNFASTSSTFAGYARPGIAVSAHLWKPLSAMSYWNINAEFVSSSVAKIQMQNFFQQALDQQYGSDQARISAFSATSWRSLRIGVGYTHLFNFIPEGNLFIQPEIGILQLISPEYTVTVTGNYQGTNTFPSDRGTGIYTGVSGGFIYKNRFTVQLGFNRTRAKMVYLASGGSPQTYAQPYSVLTFGFGVFFRKIDQTN